MDYLFMGNERIKGALDVKAATILGVKERDGKAHMATVVPKKGGSVEFVAKRVVAFINELGFSSCTVTIKTDQEASIIDLVNTIKRLRADVKTLTENSPVASSASNGVMERGVQTIEGMIRVLKDCLEMRWNTKISPNSPVLTWLVEFAAVLINRYEVGHDGKTAHERIRGKVSKMLGFEFGEKMWFRRQPVGQRLAKLESLWETGVFIGYRAQSGEYMCGTAEGAFKTRTVKRVPVEDRWHSDNENMVLHTPWSPTGDDGDEVLPAVQIAMKEPSIEIERPATREDQALPRRFYISKKDIEKYGATPGCAGCHAMHMGKNPVAHNEACRKKIEDQINMHSDGKKRTHDAEHRQKDFLAKAIEKADEMRKEKAAKHGEAQTSSSSSSRPAPMETKDDDKMEDTVDSKRKRDPADPSDEHQIPDEDGEHERWAREVGLRCIDSNLDGKHVRWAELEHDDKENTDENWNIHNGKIKTEINEVMIMEMTCEETVDMEYDMNDHHAGPDIYDDVTGQKLDSKLVQVSRQDELDELVRLEVYDEVPTSQCYEHTGRAPISARWIDINKGDHIKRKYRSRFVAREIKSKYGGDAREDLFAGTPPWEAIKILMSNVTTDFQNKKVMFIDISKAYLFAPVVHEHIYVDLPPEIHKPGICAKLKKALYGTRAAAHAWELEYSRTLKDLGFVAGSASACVFVNEAKGMEMVVHGDDFTITGDGQVLREFAKNLGEKYMVKIRGVLGHEHGDDKQITLLNRVLQWDDAGISIEADPRHAELVLREMGLDESSKGSSTTGCKVEDDEDMENLNKEESTKFRSLTARLNYMCSDRPDLQFSVKELCRDMSAPTTKSWSKLKRLSRYILSKPRLVIRFNFQDANSRLDIYSDSDWAGCRTTRKSTNGGCVMRGTHCIKSWSSTQSVIALSSGEAEYYGLTKAGCVALGMRSLFVDFTGSDNQVEIHLHTDSTAAKGIVGRKGLGKLRHLEVQYLWLQDHVAKKNFVIHKVLGIKNPGDLMTKYLAGPDIEKNIARMYMVYMSGRSDAAPELM